MTIYTANFGNYDNSYDGADIIYSEVNNPFNGCMDHFSPKLKSKLYKVLNPFMHELWMDSSMEVRKKDSLLKVFPKNIDLGLLQHPYNTTLDQEIEECVEAKFITKDNAIQIKSLYSSIGLNTKKVPMTIGGIIYRNNIGNSINSEWWNLICKYSHRDQLTLPYILQSASNLKVEVLDIDFRDNPYFKYHPHKFEVPN